MYILKELLQINEAKPRRGWDGKIKNIDALLAWMYDKDILTASEKKRKDTVINQYYRYYNDGDMPAALKVKGFNKYTDENKVEAALEEYLEQFIKSLLVKYLPKVDRAEFRLDKSIEDLQTVKTVAARTDVHGLLTYWLKTVKITDESGELGKNIDELQKLYDVLVKMLNGVEPKGKNTTVSYRREQMKEAGNWSSAMETRYLKIEELCSKIAEFIGNLIDSLKKLKKSNVMKESLNEMASSHKFNSGFMRSPAAKELVRRFKDGEETFDMKDGKSFKAVKKVAGNQLEAGMVVMGSYSGGNQGAQIYEILGFTDGEEQYGKSGVKFKSVKELLSHYKVSSLKALQTLQDEKEHGYHSYLVVKDLEDGDEGAWFYLYNGSWARGSGAEKLAFTLVEKA